MSSSSDKKPGVLGRFLSQRGMGQVITVTIGLIVLCLVFGFINPNFFTYRNTANLLRQIASDRRRTVLCIIYRKYRSFYWFCSRYELYDLSNPNVSWNESVGCNGYHIGCVPVSWLCKWHSGIKMQAATFHRNLRYNDNCKRYCTDRQW